MARTFGPLPCELVGDEKDHDARYEQCEECLGKVADEQRAGDESDEEPAGDPCGQFAVAGVVGWYRMLGASRGRVPQFTVRGVLRRPRGETGPVSDVGRREVEPGPHGPIMRPERCVRNVRAARGGGPGGGR